MNYRREIDGLRAVAVLPVVFYHAGFLAFPGGYVGVDVFFVISGYLITRLMHEQIVVGRFSILDFYERRVRRILPALVVMLMACTAAAALILIPDEFKRYSESLVATTLSASNFFFWLTSGYFETEADLKPLLHTWSLAEEEQFYLLFPFLLLLICRLAPGKLHLWLAGLALASLASCVWLTMFHPSSGYYLLPARAWELLVGSFIAVKVPSGMESVSLSAFRRDLLSGIGLLLMLVAMIFYSRNTSYPGWHAILPVAGAALVLTFATADTTVGAWLAARPLVYVGLISYSLYLWHQPMLAFLRQWLIDPPQWWLTAIALAASFFMAILSYRLVERPFRGPSRVSASWTLAATSVPMFLLLGVGFAGHASNGNFRSYRDPVAEAVSQQGPTRDDSRCMLRVMEASAVPPECVIGDAGVTPSFAFIGDSHASALLPAFKDLARGMSLSGIDLTMHSCPPLIEGKFGYDDCDLARSALFRRIRDGKLPRTLVVMARWTLAFEQVRYDNGEGGVEPGSEASWDVPQRQGESRAAAISRIHQASIRAMLDAGFQVILVYPVPEAGWDVPTRLSKIFWRRGELAPEDASTSFARFQQRNSRAVAAFDAIGDQPALVRLDPARLFCNGVLPGRCITHIGHSPLYFDDDHLSRSGASLLIGEMLPLLGGASGSAVSRVHP